MDFAMASNRSAFMNYSNRDDESIALIAGIRHGSAFRPATGVVRTLTTSHLRPIIGRVASSVRRHR